MSSVSSSDLEKRYQEDNNAVVLFTAGQEHYELSFKGNTPTACTKIPKFAVERVTLHQ